MIEGLEPERDRLVARLSELEVEHRRLHERPHDHEGHQKHLERLRVYQNDVHAYRVKLAASRRELSPPAKEETAAAQKQNHDDDDEQRG